MSSNFFYNFYGESNFYNLYCHELTLFTYVVVHELQTPSYERNRAKIIRYMAILIYFWIKKNWSPSCF